MSGFLSWARREFARDRERPSSLGGGDRRRGEMGQWGVESPELEPEAVLCGRGGLTVSVEDVGVSSGMLVDDRARWREAAEGVLALDPARLGARLGLMSVLLLRERKPDLVVVAATAPVRWGGRAGDASREDSGEVAEDGEPDFFSARVPASAWCRAEAAGPLSEAAADVVGSLAVGVSAAGVGAAGAGCVAGVDAGSADSMTPAMDW